VAFADTPLPDVDALAAAWALDLAGEATRLHGGEESAAYRLGDHVVRVGAVWRSSAMLEWTNGVALAASLTVAEAVAPVATPSGSTVVRFDDRPVTVWPFVEGTWPDENEHFEAAADLLARLHRALDGVDVGPRPQDSTPLADAPDLNDPVLDAWLLEFADSHPDGHPQHGDYYRGNLLAADGALVALVDWDEAFVGPPEIGLANAAWEWGDGLWADDLDSVFQFIDLYVNAGGTSPGLTEVALRQLVRARLRHEMRYSRQHDYDAEYEARQLLTFDRLRISTRK
jgi:Ser/Thr protein kinase RdoA (MazF antagonist)